MSSRTFGISARFYAVSFVVAAALAGLAVFGHFSLQNAYDKAEQTEKVRAPQLGAMSDLELAVTRASLQLRHAMLARTPAERDAALADATALVRARGAITSHVYSTDPAFLRAAEDAYHEAGASLACNLTGMPINFAAAYSDYHVSGLNPAGNACLADLAFVASRFRIVQRRRPLS